VCKSADSSSLAAFVNEHANETDRKEFALILSKMPDARSTLAANRPPGRLLGRRSWHMTRLRSHRFRMSRLKMLSCVGLVLLAGQSRRVDAQAGAGARSAERRAWVFGRIGAGARVPFPPPSAGGDQTLLALTAGAAASYGMMFGMVRAAYNERFSFETPDSGVQDYAALAGVRSRGDHRFAAAAVGLGLATPIGGSNDLYSLRPDRQLDLAYDFSAHAAYRVGGFAISLSGVVGPARASYVALSLGAEPGWFGSR
jgi:hypothetical protein